MIKFSILYPGTGKFDFDYCLHTHMPRSIELLGKDRGFRGLSVDRGLVGGSPSGAAPSYVAMCHYLFDTAEDFRAAFLSHAGEMYMSNYVDTEAIIQVSEVAIARFR